MDFSKVIEQRFSVRSYKPDEIEKEKLEQVLEAARLAPTAVNKQPFQFIVIRSKNRQQDLEKIYDKAWFYQAPVVIAACALYDKAWKRRDGMNYAVVDTTIAMDHLILAATNLGLGTCWIGAFDPEAVAKILNLPDHAQVIALTPLGYPADSAKPKKRAPLSQLVRYEGWE
jgi:nitroreductase